MVYQLSQGLSFSFLLIKDVLEQTTMELLNIRRPDYCGRNKPLCAQEHPRPTASTFQVKEKTRSKWVYFSYSRATFLLNSPSLLHFWDNCSWVWFYILKKSRFTGIDEVALAQQMSLEQTDRFCKMQTLQGIFKLKSVLPCGAGQW